MKLTCNGRREGGRAIGLTVCLDKREHPAHDIPENTLYNRCSHGADCQVHPAVQQLHDFTPTATDALKAVLAAVQIRHKFDADDVRQIARDMGVEL